MKPLLEYEMRRIFTLRSLLCLTLFLVIYTFLLWCLAGLGRPLEERLLSEIYRQSHYIYYSTFIINYALLAWMHWLSMALFSRGDEDIALLMRTSRTKLWVVKSLVGLFFLFFLTGLLLTVNQAVSLRLWIEDDGGWFRFASQTVTILYYTAWFTFLSLVIKSPRHAVFVMPLVFTVDTFLPAVKQHDSPLTATLSVIFPMIEPSGRIEFIHPTLWATLMLSGLIFILVFFIMREKSY